jgi:hypothetical protein
MTDQSLRRLTKAHIVELRSCVKPPHPLVEKVLSMVCILRGCVAPNWTTAREMMNSMTFKMELMLMDPRQIKPSLIKRVIKILNANQKSLTPDVRYCLSHFSIEPSASFRGRHHFTDLDNKFDKVECRAHQVLVCVSARKRIPAKDSQQCPGA